MKCNTVMEWLPHYIEGLVTPEAEREMTQHIVACPDCARWLEEARAMEEIWKEADSASDFQPLSGIPDLVPQVMAEIERLEAVRQSDGAGPAASRRRSARRTSWVHYGLAACLTFVLLQYGVFEQLGYGLTEINGHMSNSVTALFGTQGTR
ncbi:Putative zinc-finger [Paenibacillus sophorae]|uniref:Anti-sigma-W factor RsiW n=1 Tax=Paenibacillus sophorae TaxID=1333845 RepID=A0A1H8KY61_9BACL|nr:zf-HC2 domain-containing protein [Paenibacillus sophorae]QWU17510.1 zf-HC2 domain-containing protein [Paenibacillus sophorae]SEN97842.1 Putative zinc-finger [Paenibacillus sophorae]